MTDLKFVSTRAPTPAMRGACAPQNREYNPVAWDKPYLPEMEM
jgi:hypothetical protein